MQTFVITVTPVNDARASPKAPNRPCSRTPGADGPAGPPPSAGTGQRSGPGAQLHRHQQQPGCSPAAGPHRRGTLTYTPAANANGSATVSVSLHDNGGTANGGVDTQRSQTFTITVTAVNDPPTFRRRQADRARGLRRVPDPGVASGRPRPARPTSRRRRSPTARATTPTAPSRRRPPGARSAGDLPLDARRHAYYADQPVRHHGHASRLSMSPTTAAPPMAASTPAAATVSVGVTASNDARPTADAQGVSDLEDSVDPDGLRLIGSTGQSRTSRARRRPSFSSRCQPTAGCLCRPPSPRSKLTTCRSVLSNATLYFTPTCQTAPPPTSSRPCHRRRRHRQRRRRHSGCRRLHDHRHRRQRRAQLHQGAEPDRARGCRRADGQPAGPPASRAGPADESARPSTFIVSNDNNARSSAQPGGRRQRHADLHAGGQRQRHRQRSPSACTTTAAPPTAASTPAPPRPSRSPSPPSTTRPASPGPRPDRRSRTPARRRSTGLGHRHQRRPGRRVGPDADAS